MPLLIKYAYSFGERCDMSVNNKVKPQLTLEEKVSLEYSMFKIPDQFRSLSRILEAEAGHHGTALKVHPAYRALLEMGSYALPYVLDKLEEERGITWMVLFFEILLVEPTVSAPVIPYEYKGNHDVIKAIIKNWAWHREGKELMLGGLALQIDHCENLSENLYLRHPAFVRIVEWGEPVLEPLINDMLGRWPNHQEGVYWRYDAVKIIQEPYRQFPGLDGKDDHQKVEDMFNWARINLGIPEEV